MNRRSNPFTLIELLVVIAIIAILAGILLPTINIAIRRTNAAKAKSEMSTLITAITMYQSEYDVMPFAYNAAESQSLAADDYSTLVAFLSQTRNPSETVAVGEARMRAGNARKIKTLDVQKAGEFNDPWGNPYRIVYDSNYSGQVQFGLAHGLVGKGSETTIPRPILVYSLGPDGASNSAATHASNKDNVYSVDTTWNGSLGHVLQ